MTIPPNITCNNMSDYKGTVQQPISFFLEAIQLQMKYSSEEETLSVKTQVYSLGYSY